MGKGFDEGRPPIGKDGWLPPGRQRPKQFTTENDRIDVFSVRGIVVIIIGIVLLTAFSALLADTMRSASDYFNEDMSSRR
jgi:hypothetical protein